MHWFYKLDIGLNRFTTSPEESKHISRVLRMVPGDEAVFTDGQGKKVTAELLDNHPRQCRFTVIDQNILPKPRNFHLHIAVAPTKNISRLEWFLEKATEIGIDEITPLQCDHSERIRIKSERFDKIVVSALKQSRQVWMPKINELTGLSELLRAGISKDTQKLIAYVSHDHDHLLKEVYTAGNDALILIGPEGDFSESEIKTAIQQGFRPISLGQNRLRTETAALVACHTIILMNQGF
jgi:16S rRNA (uracil1498-N3)-methyltransferase